ncbi:MAG: 2-C-methyl-D-erythritol 4-phosphate cytidylyltransferase [Candidatus Sumerlaeota bacterium]|nr:2-C-methyl-D-erythritol 4-phosphate cytidylyltransferase [Candidatus Sumerlaeota bacterium]
MPDRNLLSQTGLVVVAAGNGRRFGARKQFVPLAGRPLLAWCLEAFDQLADLGERIVVLPEGAESEPEWLSIAARLHHPVRVVAGGAERADSVRAGIEALGPGCLYAAVHDGARPLVDAAWLLPCVERLASDVTLGAVIVGRSSTDTLKHFDPDSGLITGTADRTRLARAETPQVCRCGALIKALALPGSSRLTDEGQVLENAGWKTALHLIDARNPKVTLPEDIAIAEALLRRREACS